MMRRLIFISLLIVPVSLFAQRFSGGIHAGFNASQIFGDGVGGYNKAGLMGGAFVYTELSDKWGGQLEIRYSEKGSATYPRHPEPWKIKLQYIELPVLVIYDMSKKFQIQGGVSVGYLFRASRNDGYGYETFEQFDKFEAAINLGVKYALFDRLSINIRSTQSILPIYALYSGATAPYSMFNNVVTFAFYYQIGR